MSQDVSIVGQQEDDFVFNPSEKSQIKLRDTPCRSKEELDYWLRYHLNVYLPNCIVDKEYSNTSPMDMVWTMYSSALYTQEVTNALFIGNRDGGKCVKEDTLILTTEGLRKIQDVRVGNRIWTGRSVQPVLQTFNEGMKKAFTVVCNSGHELTGSHIHRIQKLNEQTGQIEWCLIKDLKKDDYVFSNNPYLKVNTHSSEFMWGRIMGGNFVKKEVPRSTSSLDYRTFDYLAGIVVGILDTTDTFCQEHFITESKSVIDILQTLLDIFGVRSKKKREKVRIYNVSNEETWNLDLIGKIRKELIPVHKSFLVENYLFQCNTVQRYPVPILRELRRILVENYAFGRGYAIVDGKRTRLIGNPTGGMLGPRPDAAKMTHHSGKLEVLVPWMIQNKMYKGADFLSSMLNGHFYKVKRVYESYERFHDLEVDVDHSYWSNGLISHNTFGAAVLEFLLLQHDNRSVTHIGAIEKQAKRAYAYFQDFYKKEKFKDFVSRMVMEKTAIDGKGTLEILPCTLAACNGPHTPLVCVHNKSRILIDNSNRDASGQDRDRVLINASQLYNKISQGLKIKAICYNHKTHKIESKPVIAAFNNGKNNIIRIERETGRDLRCTTYHKVFSVTHGKYVKAIELKTGDTILSTRKISTNVERKIASRLDTINIFKRESLNDFDRFDCYNVKHSDLKPVKIIKITLEDKPAQVYDFTVEGNHNYFADGVLVHNCRDEIDTVQDLQAYKDISGIPTQMPDGRPPIKIGISTRKCVTKNCFANLIIANNRSDPLIIPRRVSELKVGDNVEGLNGVQTVVNAGKSGIQRCYRITLANRRFIEVSHQHRNIVINGYDKREVKTVDLEIGDFFLCSDYKISEILKIEDIGDQETYNIEVTGDHLYFCNDILTSNTAFGLVQQEVESSKKTGMKVFTWGILECTRRCPDERSGTKEIPLYVYLDKLTTLTEAEYCLLSNKDKTLYQKYTGFEGCLTNCKLFAVCRAQLKNQTCNSPFLREIDFVQDQVFESSEEWTLAQHMSIKPAPTGLVYSNFTEKRNVRSYKQMVEHFLGRDLGNVKVELEDLIKIFEGHGLTATVGIDFGYNDPYVCELMYIDTKKDHIYLVAEHAVTKQDGDEVALWLQKNWQSMFNIEIIYPDIESPSNIKLLRKRGFTCAGAKKDADAQGAKNARFVNKDIKGGIETVRRFIKVPGSNETKFFVHESCELFLSEVTKYHYKVDRMGNVIADEPEDDQNHACFVGETLIRMADGSEKRIDQIQEGEIISTPLGPRRALESGCTGLKNVYCFTFSNGSQVCSTEDHPYYIYNEGFKSLSVGESVILYSEEFAQGKEEETLTPQDAREKVVGKLRNKKSQRSYLVNKDLFLESTPVYNLKIENAGCYFANDILVSNCDAVRYPLHSIYGHKEVNALLDMDKPLDTTKDLETAPTVGELAARLGLDFNDNEDEYDDAKKRENRRSEVKQHLGIDLPGSEEEGDDDKDDGFSFSF